MMEHKVISKMIAKMLPPIKVNEYIWVPFMESQDAFKIENILNRNIPEIKRVKGGEVLFGNH
jgi:hypothetical protein